MQTVSASVVKNQRVLLRMDLDVPIKNGVILEEFRIVAGLPTLELCLTNAASVVICGHLGRPEGKVVESLSVAPTVNWLEDWYCDLELPQGRLHVLENLRFESGEQEGDPNFAKELAMYGDIFVNEAFASHHKSSSTTELPKLLPSFAGLRFAKEVETLLGARNNPKRPLVAVIGGVKIEDKYPAVVELSKFCDATLVGGLLAQRIREQNLAVNENVVLAKLASSGIDIDQVSLEAFKNVLSHAKQVIFGGPMGKYEDPQGIKGTLEVAQAMIASGAETIVGGGDSIAALNSLLDKFSFVSTGGGAMLKLLCQGTLPTIEALNYSQTS